MEINGEADTGTYITTRNHPK